MPRLDIGKHPATVRRQTTNGLAIASLFPRPTGSA